MRRYKLLKDLPTFKAGETFFIDDRGNLCAEETQGYKQLVAYTAATLKKFPNIWEEWFEEELEMRVPFDDTHYYIGDDGEIHSSSEIGYLADDRRFNMGDYFKTRVEAEIALSKIKAYATVKRDAKGYEWNPDKANCHIYYDSNSKSFDHLVVGLSHWTREVGEIYFATYKDAEELEDLFGAPPILADPPISLCRHCYCMTKTLVWWDGTRFCGKCKEVKDE